MLPIWVHAVVAFGIALLAFIVGQIVPGLGVTVVAGVSTGWTAYAAHRARVNRAR